MRNPDYHQQGFTMVELLMVMVIVGILVTLALGAYSAARKQTIVNLAADRVATLIRDEKVKAMSGVSEEDSGLKFRCYRTLISGNKIEEYIDDWDGQNCVDSSSPVTEEDLNPRVEVSNFEVQYKPPYGAIAKVSTDPYVLISLIGETSNLFKRVVQVDENSSKINIINCASDPTICSTY